MAATNKTEIVKLDARAIWGKFLLALRENKELSLHSLCVELSDYHIEDKTFFVGVTKKINYDSLRKLANQKRINEIFASLNLGLEIQIYFKESKLEDTGTLISQILGVKVSKK